MAFRRKKKGSAEKAAGKAQRKAAWAKRKPIVGRLLIVALALVLCIVPVLFINNIMGYLPLLALVLIIFISFIYLQVLTRSLEFSEDSLLSSCRRGTDIDFVVNFKNKSPFVFLRIEGVFYISNLFDETDTEVPASFVLMPFEQRDFEFAARFDHIGEYNAGVDRLVIYDLLGLFSHTIVNENKTHKISVLPRVFDITSLDLSNISVQENSRHYQPIVTDDMDYAGVREYAWGDPLKTIHWKLSARRTDGNYYTRLFETQGNPGVAVIADSTSPEYDSESLMQIFDGVVESAVSTCLYAYEAGVDAELIYADKYGEFSKAHVLNVGDSLQLIRDMAKIEVADGHHAVDRLLREGLSVHAQANIVFCTAHVNEETISALIEIKVRKRNPVLFVVIPRSLDGNEKRSYLAPLRRLQDASITYYVLTSAADLLEEVQ